MNYLENVLNNTENFYIATYSIVVFTIVVSMFLGLILENRKGF